MPLLCYELDKQTREWQKTKVVLPRSVFAISDNNLLEGNQLFVLLCREDDQATIVYKIPGVYESRQEIEQIFNNSGPHKVVANLGDGQEYILTVSPDNTGKPFIMRLKHVAIDYGTTYCEICSEDVPSNKFGEHVFSGHKTEVLSWPKGIKALHKQVRAASLQASIAAVEHEELIVRIARNESSWLEHLQRLKEAEDRRISKTN